MKTEDFRKELLKKMPGYKWTVHNSLIESRLNATGIQSSGFNRTSTLDVVRKERDGKVSYNVKSAGFGKKAKWLSESTGDTLSQALRNLQNHYEDIASEYRIHAEALAQGRKLGAAVN